MKRITLLTLVCLLVNISAFSQITEQNDKKADFNIVFDTGLLLGHSESYYPAPFSANISFLKNYKDRLWFGAGSGAAIIGKTFIPLYADFRIKPFSSKPFFIYNKTGWTLCANKSYSEGNQTDYYYVNYPHPLNENIITKGGIMNEIGIGILLDKKDWNTIISIAYRYQKTKDELKNSYTKTYENNFNRLAVRVGFWF